MRAAASLAASTLTIDSLLAATDTFGTAGPRLHLGDITCACHHASLSLDHHVRSTADSRGIPPSAEAAPPRGLV